MTTQESLTVGLDLALELALAAERRYGVKLGRAERHQLADALSRPLLLGQATPGLRALAETICQRYEEAAA